MILAFDTAYTGNRAKTVCLAFHDWSDRIPANIHSETIEGVADYEPGQFYKREFPLISRTLFVESVYRRRPTYNQEVLDSFASIAAMYTSLKTVLSLRPPNTTKRPSCMRAL